jgi:hypothetical protein
MSLCTVLVAHGGRYGLRGKRDEGSQSGCEIGKLDNFHGLACEKPLTKHATRQRFTCEKYYFDINFSENYSEFWRT